MFQAHLKACLAKNLENISLALKDPNPTWDNLVTVLEEAERNIEQHWAYFSHLHAVQNTNKIRKIYNRCLPLLVQYETKLLQYTKLYKAILSIPTANLSATRQHIIFNMIRDFEHNGISLATIQKKRLKNIAANLSKLQTKFEQNLIDAELAYTLHVENQFSVQGIPEHIINAARKKAQELKLSSVVFGIDAPCYQAIITYAYDRKLRETLYHAYITKASAFSQNTKKYDNSLVLNDILHLRHEEAKLLNFPSYAAYSLKLKMVKTEKKALDFINDLIIKVKPYAEQEALKLKQYAKTHWQIDDLKPWDIAFISEKLKTKLFAFEEETLRQYFNEITVWRGIELILEKLYDLQLTQITAEDVWHKDVRVFTLTRANKTIGTLYVDLFARPYKKNGAWMDSLKTRMRLKNGTIYSPVATLTCNFALPKDGETVYFYHDDLVTLFHELGHCLHHLLTNIDEFSASGIHGVEWDAIELPSQIFEYWCWQKESLNLLAEPKIPDDMLNNLLKSKTFNAGLHILRQLEFALFDLQIHSTNPQNAKDWVHEILQEIRKTTALFPIAPYNRFQNSFSHIFAGGYAAGYYSYLWAEVLSADCFSRFEKEGLFNSKTGKDFLREILARGGSRNAEDNIQAFLGRKMSMDAFLHNNFLCEKQTTN